MIEVAAATEIAAPAAAVWEVLSDVEQFHEWNPFIRDVRGTTEVGGTLRVRVRPSRGPRLVFHATVLTREANRELRWRGHFLAPWFATGDHSFTIEPLGNGRVRFVQHETFSGLLPLLGKRLLAHEIQRGFDAMNRALETRATGNEARPR